MTLAWSKQESFPDQQQNGRPPERNAERLDGSIRGALDRSGTPNGGVANGGREVQFTLRVAW